MITHLVPSVFIPDDKHLPPTPTYDEKNRYESSITLEPGAHKACKLEIPNDTVVLLRHLGNSEYKTDADKIHFIGYLRFSDKAGVKRSMGFCRRRDRETKRFVVVNDPDYEYAD